MKMYGILLFTTFCAMSGMVCGDGSGTGTGSGTGSMTGTGTGTGSGTFVAPVSSLNLFHYSCKADTAGPTKGQVTVDIIAQNLSSNINEYAISNTEYDYTLKPNNSSDKTTCHQGLTPITRQPQTNATITLENCNMTGSLFLYLLRSRPKRTVVYGGKNFHIYKLDCSIDTKTNYNIDGKFSAATAYPNKESIERPDLKLTMNIAKNGSGDIHIGDSLVVTVTDISSPKLYLGFHRCDAMVTPAKTPTVQLLDNGVAFAAQDDIIEKQPDNFQNPGTISFTISAFRFESSNSVSITCTMQACNQKGCQRKRRRRSTNEKLNGVVQATYTVSDDAKTSGQEKVYAGWSIVVVLVLASKIF